MASSTTKTKTIRIANDTADFFEGKALNRMVECVHHLIKNGTLAFDGENLKILSSVNTEEKLPEYEDLKGMVEFFGMTMDDFIQQADVALSEGVLTISDGKLVCVLPEWAERLSEACHELGYDVEKITDSAIKSLSKGML